MASKAEQVRKAYVRFLKEEYTRIKELYTIGAQEESFVAARVAEEYANLLLATIGKEIAREEYATWKDEDG